ncbi:MAG: helix-turn-helix domain-containing protein [Oscillospiraceae bacterium]|nr:helix-turn-helix domain-containing protein [Oscillospiraceae bacterium]
MEYYQELGSNIRQLRKLRGYSLQDLSDRIQAQCAADLSANLISMWERGERRITVSQLDCLCKGLGCTPNLLCPGYNAEPSQRVLQEYTALSEEEKRILEYAALEWDGNTHALIQFCALYMALPRRLREGIAFVGISAFEKGQKENVILPDAPPVDVAYIEAQWRHLLHRD